MNNINHTNNLFKFVDNSPTIFNFKNNNLNEKINQNIRINLCNKISSIHDKDRWNFHLLHNREDYLLIVKIKCIGKEAFKIKEMKVLSFNDAQIYKNAPTTKLKFIEDLQKFTLIEGGDQLVPSRPPIKDKKIQAEFKSEKLSLPNYIEIKNSIFYFSREVLEGMEGLRGPDHKIEVDLLQLCLKYKMNKFKKDYKPANRQQPISLYFMMKNPEKAGKILNLVVYAKPLDQGKKVFVVLTAYFMPPISFKGREKLNQMQFEQIAQTLPEVSEEVSENTSPKQWIIKKASDHLIQAH